MTKKLLVTIGPDRFHVETAWVNDTTKPTLIDTEYFVGRVLVYVRDFVGVTPDKSPPKKHSSYFDGRSRKFAILIEGRFKHRPGAKPYTGDEIMFGSDFDYLPESFPHGPFNAGMRIAQMVDPATFYEEHPPTSRPYIMSPYVACMNTFCAYPAPDARHRAYALAFHDAQHPHVDHEKINDEDMVAVEVKNVDNSKRHNLPHWRFVGLEGDVKVDEFVKAHSHLLVTGKSAPSKISPINTHVLGDSNTITASPVETTKSLESPKAPEEERKGRSGPVHPSIHKLLGTRSNSKVRSSSPDVARLTSKVVGKPKSTSDLSSNASSTEDEAIANEQSLGSIMWGAPIITSEDTDSTTDLAAEINALKLKSGSEKKSPSHSRFNFSHMFSSVHEEDVHPGDLVSLKDVELHVESTISTPLDSQLGPWRFDDEKRGAAEDNLFFFLDTVSHSVQERRKYFCDDHGQHRKEFVFDPCIIYTASFFTSFCDLNTLDLRMGPISINLQKYFRDMPIRYTLRSTRIDPNTNEEEVFATIAFQIVDED